MMKGIRTTIIGGAIFLVPFVFIVLILEEAYNFALKVAEPISEFIPIDGIGDIALVNILAAVLVVLVCFGAGRLARSSSISGRVNRIDQFFTRAFPLYHPTKRGITDTVVDKSFEDEWTPALIGPKSGRRTLGFQVETLESGDSVVFLPSAPNPRAGSVATVPSGEVELIDIEPRQFSAIIKGYGTGASKVL